MMWQRRKIPRLVDNIASSTSSDSDIDIEETVSYSHLEIGTCMPDSTGPTLLGSLDVGSVNVSEVGLVPEQSVEHSEKPNTERRGSVRGIPGVNTSLSVLGDASTLSVSGISHNAGSSTPADHHCQVQTDLELPSQTVPLQVVNPDPVHILDFNASTSLPIILSDCVPPSVPALMQMDSSCFISEKLTLADNCQDEESENESLPDQHYFSSSSDEEDSVHSDSSVADEYLTGIIPELPPDNILFSGSPITVDESLLSILSFAQSETLSGVGLSKLLSLIELHCPKPNKCLSSYNQILTHFKNVKTPMDSYFYCNKCLKERISLTDKCDSCNQLDSPIDQVIVLSLVDQLSELYKRPGFINDIQYRFHREKINHENLEDIYDGRIYKELQADTLSNKHNVSLMWNIDGVSPQDSSDLQVWPCYAVINELPPETRFKRENLILLGVYVGHSKPHPNIFFKNIYPKVKRIREGFEVNVPSQSEPLFVQAVFMCGTCDSPARAAVFNMKSFNGYYSCPKCLSKGEKSERSDNVFVHPYEEYILRTEQGYEQDAQLAVLSNANVPASLKVSPNGIKGTSFLYLIVDFMIRSTAIDTMHCLYLGCMKQFLELWFGKTHKAENFSLYKVRKVVSHRLLSIRLPAFVKRMPRRLGLLAKLKAYEFMLLLYFYLLPVLDGIMQQDYFHNFKLFVSGVSLLNKTSVSPLDIESAKVLLIQFVKDFQELYGVRNMSFNIHLVLHLPLVTEELGPTQYSTCFGFENLNGILCRLIHGNRYVGSQIASKLFMFLHLPRLIDTMAAGNVKDYCLTVHKKWKRLRLIENMFGKSFSVGTYWKVLETPPWMLASLEAQQYTNIFSFHRIRHNSMLITSQDYSKNLKTCSSFVRYIYEGRETYGQVKTFVKLTMCSCSNTCLCPGTYLALISLCTSQCAFTTANPPSVVQYIKKAYVSETVHCISIKNIVNVCFCIKLSDIMYLCDILNVVEMYN